MLKHIVMTDDLGHAQALSAYLLQLQGGQPAAAVPAAPALAPPPPLPPAAPALAPPPALPPALPAAAPPPTPAPVAVNPALMVAPDGWTIEHINGAATAFTTKHGPDGNKKLIEIVKRYCAEGTAKPSVSKAFPAYWPNLYQDLTA